MASAAAVAADSMESPLDETTTADGAFTASVRPRDSATPAGSDIAGNGANGLDEDGEAGDLFGDDADDDGVAQKRRLLDDEELDSGDDEGRDDRLQDGEEEAPPYGQKEVNIVECDLPRTGKPQPSDGELYLLKLPNFLEIDPKAFTLANFRPPTTDHRSKTTPSATFSAYSTAMGTIRWRHSPSNPEELQSNARVLRWSDGSLTLQLASEPMIQYELPSNPLAPPQINPKKPTPTAMTDKRNKSQQHHYNAGKDSFTYLATPHPDHAIMRFTNKLTTGLSVVPPAGAAATDDALERLQETMAAAQRAKEQLADGGMIIDKEMLEDPELAKKRAEQAEKEKMRAQRRSETQISRERERTGRTLGRAGVRTGGGGGGLTVGGLEDDEAGGAAGGRYAGGRPSKPKKRRPLRDEYSDEDDYAGRRRTKEDEYDEEDDFIAGSEEEIVEEDSEEDMDERIERQQHERERVREGSGTPKRSRQASAEGEGPPQASPKATKRRRIIDDDDDE